MPSHIMSQFTLHSFPGFSHFLVFTSPYINDLPGDQITTCCSDKIFPFLGGSEVNV